MMIMIVVYGASGTCLIFERTKDLAQDLHKSSPDVTDLLCSLALVKCNYKRVLRADATYESLKLHRGMVRPRASQRISTGKRRTPPKLPHFAQVGV